MEVLKAQFESQPRKALASGTPFCFALTSHCATVREKRVSLRIAVAVRSLLDIEKLQP